MRRDESAAGESADLTQPLNPYASVLLSSTRRSSLPPCGDSHADWVARIRSWAEEDPWDRSRWYTQHDALLRLDAPYVYHVVSLPYISASQATADIRSSMLETRRSWLMRFARRGGTRSRASSVRSITIRPG